MKLPTIKQCLLYFDQFAMLENIRAHSIMVARVAATLHDALVTEPHRATALPPKKEVIIGALMHDIAKTPCLATEERHAECGQKICQKLGYPELGEIVAEHVLLKNFTEKEYARGIFGSKEIVFYADKRVNHDQLATLEQRQEYILARYGKGEEKRIEYIHANFAAAFILESHIFARIAFKPQQLEEHLASLPELMEKANDRN